MIIAREGGVTLRHARVDDLPRVDEITIACYASIYRSYVQMLGEECYRAVRHDPQLTWEERKTGQVHRLFRDHPDWVWVLEKESEVIGFVTFMLFRDQNYGHIDNNGVAPEHVGRGLGRFMYQHVLRYFRKENVRFAHVDTGLDDAHIPARKAYESVGFSRKVPSVEYWQDLKENEQSSTSN